MFSKNKVILIAVILLAITVALSMFLIKPKQATKTPPLPVQQNSPDSNITLSPQRISFNLEKRDKLIELMNDKPSLSSADLAVKNNILAKINNQSGYLQETDEYKIEYIKSGDLFQVELLVTEHSFAKIKAQSWFETQGFSNQAICNLPIMFYLSAEAKAQLTDKDINFNYLPEGC